MTKDYFFDTDCLSSFLWVNNVNILKELYGGKIIFPSQVYDELSNPAISRLKQRVDDLIEDNGEKVQEIEVEAQYA